MSIGYLVFFEAWTHTMDYTLIQLSPPEQVFMVLGLQQACLPQCPPGGWCPSWTPWCPLICNHAFQTSVMQFFVWIKLQDSYWFSSFLWGWTGWVAFPMRCRRPRSKNKSCALTKDLNIGSAGLVAPITFTKAANATAAAWTGSVPSVLSTTTPSETNAWGISLVCWMML